MDASHTPDYDRQHWNELLRDSLNQQRDQVREFLAAQKKLIRQVEDQLVEQLDQIIKQFDDKPAEDDGSSEKDYRRLYEMAIEDIHELKAQNAEIREQLETLQAHGQEKLRQAEIDISQERAKIAREKAQIEEKLRALDEHNSNSTSEHQNGEKTGRPARGRWLAQLGLNSPEDE